MSYAYDAKGQLLEKLDKKGYLTKYGYTVQGDVNRIAYADGRKVTYSYDSERRLSGLEDGNGTITYGCDNAGRPARKTFPDGMETSYAYDMAGVSRN